MDKPKYLDLRFTDIEVLHPICDILNFLYGLAKRFPLPQEQLALFENSFLSDDYSYKHMVIFFLADKYLSEEKYDQLRDFIEGHKNPGFNFLDYPFLISTERKVEILQFETKLEKISENPNSMDLLFAGLFSNTSLNIKVGHS